MGLGSLAPFFAYDSEPVGRSPLERGIVFKRAMKLEVYCMAEYVKFKVPKELSDRSLGLLEKVRKGGKLKIGSNEVTKAIERQKAKLVLMAEDVTPPEIMMHLPLICAEKNVPYGYVATRKELGEKSGIGVATTAVAIVEEGDSKKELEEIVKKLNELRQ